MLVALPAFVIGLLGSAHCVGMCGGLVVALHHGRPHPARRQALYLVGKTAAYAALGAVAGGLGTLAGLAVAGGQGMLSVLMGVVLVVAGLAACGVWKRHGGTGSGIASGSGAVALFARPIGRLVASERSRAVLGLGALNGLLPCGLVYAMLAHAAALGSASLGALALAAFGIGTAPALALVGTLGGRIPIGRRVWMQRAAGGLVVVLGVLTLARAAIALSAGSALSAPAASAPLFCLPGG